ncbi:hypothetical protein Q7C_2573 [Methylophaga frappieri]|uniref:Secreted protein n=1 Tax=Methylophaga frappieri (strain ATCC BAA-2434 / DSM 25690 / JAM7) TaxID=754477 RepID=I1YLA1_METFJ|nr:hypothetical protein [Methylophaga frappieri]AFJ03694.1 hypothetical protein Q7C_2573 [Methylophaga frappieri]
MTDWQNNNSNWAGLASLASLLVMLLAPVVSASPTDSDADDRDQCGEARIHYIDDPGLSRAERLARMEQAFFDSVNRFETCELTSTSDNQGNSAQQGESGQNGPGSAGQSGAASQEMQGTEAASEGELPVPGDGQSPSDQPESSTDSPPLTAGSDNGAVPEDIPSANNDDAIAAQIRRAAELETDPEIRQKLWNEYRKYKGLDVVE